jgi:hypothetical protein
VVFGIPGNLYYVDLNLVPYDPSTFQNYYWIEVSSPFHLVEAGWHVGTFVQDAYKPIDNLTFRYGFRYDYSYLVNDTDFPVINMGVFGPRFYVAWDPWGDEKTVIRGGYGRFNSLGNISIASELSQSALNTKLFIGEYFSNYGSTTDQLASFSINSNEQTSNDYLTAPHSDEFTIGAQREIIQDLAFGTSFTAKFTRNVFAFDETNVIWNQDGSNYIGVSNGEVQSLYRLRTPTVSRRDYYQTDVQLKKNFADRWQLLSTYSYVVSRGTILTSTGTAGLAVPPQVEYSYGNIGTDVRHQVKASGSYDLPFDPWTTSIGAQIQYYSGYPVNRYYYSDGFGSSYLLKQPLGTYTRMEPTYYFDLMVRQAFDVKKGQLWVNVTLENLLNARQATSYSTSGVWTANRWLIGSRQTPMQLSLALEYKF